MTRFRKVIQKFTLTVAIVVLIGGYTLPAFADDPPACPASNGTTAPTGADAQAYSFNANTCLWENDYYIWNPVTKVTTPKYTQTYSFNNVTGQWDYPIWLWNAASGAYQQITLSAAQPPAGAITVGGPPALSPTTAASTDTSSDPAGGGDSIATTATVNNNLGSTATSGDALVLANTTAGSAASGSAVDMATIINILQSTTSLQGGGVTSFTKDIGDYTGDIVLDPSTFSSLNDVDSNTTPTDLTINSKVNGQINNNVDLTAGSGNATVMGNTTAGDATTGDAAAIANIVNVINSMIGAGQSFVGTININGALHGDLLLPQGTLDSLLASGASSAGQPSGSTFNANITDNSSINNTLNLAAKSGSATVSDNTTAGNATSGDASTNITLLNLTGKQVIGGDALLVFVNVMGKWVGMIVNAPTGSNSAALCDCRSDNIGGAADSNITANTNSSISNNVNLKAASGNALVNHNTTAGSATSGNALASVNLLNISASSLSLSNWLGVLFINVFGSWNGSFGIDTLAGGLGGGSGDSTVSSPTVVKAVKVFTVTPSAGGQSYSITPAGSVDNLSSPDNSNKHPLTLAAVTNNPSDSAPGSRPSLLWTAGSLFLLAGIITTEEAIARRKAARANFRRYLDAITVQPFKRD